MFNIAANNINTKIKLDMDMITTENYINNIHDMIIKGYQNVYENYENEINQVELRCNDLAKKQDNLNNEITRLDEELKLNIINLNDTSNTCKKYEEHIEIENDK